MIRLFFIKNKFKNQKLVNNDKKILEKYTNIAQKSKDEILNEFNSHIEKGLSSKIIEEKHKNDEKNIVYFRFAYFCLSIFSRYKIQSGLV